MSDVNGHPDSLHVKVMKVMRDSKARAAGVHTQMYLKSLSLGSSTGYFGQPVFIGGDICRKKSKERSRWEIEGDIWRQSEDIPKQTRAVDLSALIELVDDVLTTGYLGKNILKVDMVSYKH
jgi:hypothetical protein